MGRLNFSGARRDSTPPANLVDSLRAIAAVTHPDDGNISGVVSTADGTIAHHLIAVSVDDDAADVLNDVIAEMERRRTQLSDPLRSIWARFYESVAKVGMIRAIADAPEAPVLTSEHATWAAALVRWCVETAAYNVRTSVADSQAEREINLILNVLREAGDWVSATKLARSVRSIKADQRGKILADLVNVQRVVEMRKSNSTPPAFEYRYIG